MNDPIFEKFQSLEFVLQNHITEIERILKEMRSLLDGQYTPLDKLELPDRIYHALRRSNVTTVERAREIAQDKNLALSIRNFGEIGLSVLQEAIRAYDARQQQVNGKAT